MWGGEEMAKNKNNANPKATRFNAEMAEEAGAKNTKRAADAANIANINEETNK
jgi:hypothetical protein